MVFLACGAGVEFVVSRCVMELNSDSDAISCVMVIVAELGRNYVGW